jgi:hypothetical protein
MEKAAATERKAVIEKNSTNFLHQMRIVSINNSYAILTEVEKEESELQKELREINVKWEAGEAKTAESISQEQMHRISLEFVRLRKKRALDELDQSINQANKFSEAFASEKDATKALALLTNDEVKNSMVFNLDEI